MRIGSIGNHGRAIGGSSFGYQKIGTGKQGLSNEQHCRHQNSDTFFEHISWLFKFSNDIIPVLCETRGAKIQKVLFCGTGNFEKRPENSVFAGGKNVLFCRGYFDFVALKPNLVAREQFFALLQFGFAVYLYQSRNYCLIGITSAFGKVKQFEQLIKLNIVVSAEFESVHMVFLQK
jgi:hypothetical protein